MSESISRRNYRDIAPIVSGQPDSAEIPLAGVAGGLFLIPADWDGGASVSFKMAATPGGTFGTLKDKTNATVSITVTAGCWYPFPPELVQGGAAKIVAASNPAANRTITWVAKG